MSVARFRSPRSPRRTRSWTPTSRSARWCSRSPRTSSGGKTTPRHAENKQRRDAADGNATSSLRNPWRRPRLSVRLQTKKGHAMAKNTICIWYGKDAEAAARFYAETFPDSAVGAVRRAPSDYPSGKKGDVLVVQFTVLGVPCIGLNGGPMFKHNEAFSFQIATDDQQETDRY